MCHVRHRSPAAGGALAGGEPVLQRSEPDSGLGRPALGSFVPFGHTGLCGGIQPKFRNALPLDPATNTLLIGSINADEANWSPRCPRKNPIAHSGRCNRGNVQVHSPPHAAHDRTGESAAGAYPPTPLVGLGAEPAKGEHRLFSHITMNWRTPASGE